MRLQVDTTYKTITVLDDVSMRDLIKALAQMFPEESWMDYKLLRPQNQPGNWQGGWLTFPGDTTNPPWTVYGSGSPVPINTGVGSTSSVFNVDYNATGPIKNNSLP
jgi:hypothetical protein